jgi:hypothetical protein
VVTVATKGAAAVGLGSFTVEGFAHAARIRWPVIAGAGEYGL